MDEIAALKEEIVQLECAINALQERLSEKEKLCSELESLKFIKENNLTLENTESSSNKDKPWFGHINEFSKWLIATNCQKPWCEWNGVIYITEDIKSGKMLDTPARYKDLK